MRHLLVLPDLGLGELPITASLWLVEPGSRVTRGDRLLEVLADGVTVDLPSPVTGVLVDTLVSEDEPLKIGQPLAVLEATEP